MNVRHNSANWSEWDGDGGGSPRARRCGTKCINDAALILRGLIQ